MQERLGLLATADPYIGKYFSVDYVRRKILRQTDMEILEQDVQMSAEKEAGIIPPSQEEMMMANQAAQATGGIGNIPQDMEIDTDSFEAPESPGLPKGGEI